VKSATLTIGATAAALASVTLNPSIPILKTAGAGQVTLTGPAPAGGAVVALAVSEPMEVELPSSATVPPDNSRRRFRWPLQYSESSDGWRFRRLTRTSRRRPSLRSPRRGSPR
jgi:hypothetical protein